ncbi:sensor histidine kinase [Alistipes sp.]|uniref:sensor histidine kinase n=1 Tax=Alistipes sp. TaxID=1872444 RepID=UPI003AEF9FDF
MKLVYRIVLHMSWLLTLLVGAWAALFYVVLVDEIDDQTDEMLENRAEVLVRRMLGGAQPREGEGFCIREAEESDGPLGRMVYTDEETYFPHEDERQPARVGRMLFRDAAGRRYEVTVMSPSVEKEDLQETILGWVVALYLLLLGTILAVNAAVVHRTLRPLRALLRWLDDYAAGGENPPLRSDTRITEFRRLNEAAMRYAARAEALLERQKQFTGNASHEMQTPLAVCRNRLEMLVDESDTLTERQLTQIAKVQRTLDGLVRLNRSLLLLTRIENGRFPGVEEVDLAALAERLAGEIGEVHASRGLRFELRAAEPLRVEMNPELAGVLVGNLLKNAFLHAPEGGEVTVVSGAGELLICNTASDGPLDASRIFDRFYRADGRKGSAGLGLALVEAVCRLYGAHADYAYEAGRHCFRVRFAK